MNMRLGGDVGETLVEIIVAIALMGIAIPSVIGAVLVAVDSSSQDRRQVQAQQVLTSWSERIVEKTTDDAAYGSCPTLAKYASAPYALTSLPPGFSTSVQSVDVPAGATFAACTNPENGIRRLKLRVTVTGGLWPAFDVDRYLVLRKPCPSC